MSGVPDPSAIGPSDSSGASFGGSSDATDTALGPILAIGLGGAGVMVVGGWFTVARRRPTRIAAGPRGETFEIAPGPPPMRTSRSLLVTEDQLAELERARHSRTAGWSSYQTTSSRTGDPVDAPRPTWVRRLEGRSPSGPDRSDDTD